LAGWKHGVKGVIAVEKHQDGNSHFHLYVKMPTRTAVRTATYFDRILPGHHCNIKLCDDHPGGVRGWVKYITKGHEYYEHDFSVSDCLAKKGQGFEKIITGLVEDPDSADQLLMKHPVDFARHINKIQPFEREVKRIRREKERAPKKFDVYVRNEKDEDIPYPEFFLRDDPAQDVEYDVRLDVITWIKENVYPAKRKFKQPQLLITGPSNIGKTTLVYNLLEASNMHAYWAPISGGYDDFDDKGCDIMVYDEFRCTRTIQEMNVVLEGRETELQARYMNKKKKENKPVIILTNLGLDQMYQKVPEAVRESFFNRLRVVNVFGDELKSIVFKTNKE
jgi:hypothetical protein